MKRTNYKPKNPTVMQFILEHFNWTGKRMVFPYMLNGRYYKATVELKDLYRIIKWENDHDHD